MLVLPLTVEISILTLLSLPVVCGISLVSLPDTEEWFTEIESVSGMFIVMPPETLDTSMSEGKAVLVTVNDPEIVLTSTLSNAPVTFVAPETLFTSTLAFAAVLSNLISPETLLRSAL